MQILSSGLGKQASKIAVVFIFLPTPSGNLSELIVAMVYPGKGDQVEGCFLTVIYSRYSEQ